MDHEDSDLGEILRALAHVVATPSLLGEAVVEERLQRAVQEHPIILAKDFRTMLRALAERAKADGKTESLELLEGCLSVLGRFHPEKPENEDLPATAK